MIAFHELRGDPEVTRDRVRLAGRCHDGPIRIGDVFTEAVTADGTREIALRVDRMLLYGRAIDELDPVVTAELTLSGRGARQVVAGVLLRGLRPN